MLRLRPVAISAVLCLLGARPSLASYSSARDAYRRKDFPTAHRDFLVEAKKGDARAQYWVGVMYYEGEGVQPDYAEALKWFHAGAAQDDPASMYEIGRLYKFGRGVPRDSSEAWRWYQMSANRGYRMAQNDLGVLYLTGNGVPKDPAIAAEWFGKAALQKDALAMRNLAELFEDGTGVARNPVEALAWYRVAAEAGDDKAPNARDRITKAMNAGQLAEADRIVTRIRADQRRTNRFRRIGNWAYTGTNVLFLVGGLLNLIVLITSTRYWWRQRKSKKRL